VNKDSTLENIWETRRRIYAQCDNNPVKLVEYYIALQKENPERFDSSLSTKVLEKESKIQSITNIELKKDT